MITPIDTVVFQDDTEFAKTFLYVQNKQAQRQRLRFNSVQTKLLRNLTGRDLVLKPRQVGISTAIQARIFRLLTTEATRALTLGHNDKATFNLRERQDYFYREFPVAIKPARAFANAAETTYPDFDSRHSIATAGSPDAVRSGSVNIAHLTEAAFYKDLGAVLTALRPMLHGPLILESTPNGAQGKFYEMCMEAREGVGEYHLHFFAWWEDNDNRLPLDADEWLDYTDEEIGLIERHGLTAEQIKWRRAAQAEYRQQFVQEYPEDPVNCFLLSGVGYFGALDGVFAAPNGAEPQEGHVYYGGLDFGQSNDYTVLSIVDYTTKQQVYLLRINRLSWGEMRRQIVNACRRWNLKAVYAEYNSIGNPNYEELSKELDNIHRFTTTADTKPRALASLHEALNENDWKLLNIPEQVREMRAFAAKQSPLTLRWSYGAPDGEHDDIVIANMLAIYAASRPIPGVGRNING